MIDTTFFLAYLVTGESAFLAARVAAPGTGFLLDLTSAEIPFSVQPCGLRDIFVHSDQASQPGFAAAVEKLGASRVWVSILPDAVADVDVTVSMLGTLSSEFECIPVTGSHRFLKAWLKAGNPAVALKGSESSGFVSVDSIQVLYSAVERMRDDAQIYVWGGMGTSEATAAFLGSGASGVIFESIHWLTDLVGLDDTQKASVRALRSDGTSLVGAATGMPWRFFDKGNSKAVRGLTKIADCLGDEALEAAGRQLGKEALERGVHPFAGTFSANDLIPLGPEAAFAQRFESLYGSAASAFSRFEADVRRLVRDSAGILERFDSSPAARKLGVRYPIIQGGMTWITDNFDFARAVEAAGGLPTLTLGLRNRQYLEQDFGAIIDEMGDRPYAVNALLLEENPCRDEQLDWIEKVRPPFVAVAAGPPSFIKRFAELGIRVIYLAPTVGLLQLAARAGAAFVVLEGNEAGGHVGEDTTFSLTQAALVLRQDSPELFEKTHVIVAGGVYDRRSAFRAAMLGGEGVQMGTAYLTTREITETGALRQQYQQLVVDAEPGTTVLSGESIGLRVRSLKTPKLDDICTLERRFAAQGVNEAERRMELEKVSVGTLFVAARGVNRADGSVYSDEHCLREGQFMSGSVAGNLSETVTLEELHAAVAAAPMEFGRLPESAPSFRPDRGSNERIAITGMAAANSLGNSYDEIFKASINLESGVKAVPADRWDHSRHHSAGARVPNVYTGIGGFMDIKISRTDIKVSPQDFRTMAESSKLTLLLARQALEESGLLESHIDKTRIAVITSQNSAENASTVRKQLVSVYAEEIVDEIAAAVPMTAEQRNHAIRDLRASGMIPDDTTLIGRLNCTAAGHICNQYALNGPSYSVGAACASSLIAVHCAMMLVRQGIVDAAVVGGGEELLTAGHYYEFSALGSLAGLSGVRRNPSEYSRPFDKDRDGFVLGEGGAVLVIERESVARARGAKSHAYITGIGACTNHEGIVESVSRTQQIALRASFDDIDYGPEGIDLIECHGTSTNQGDREEVHALGGIYPFGNKSVLASFKSQVGHTLGASGITSLIRGVMCMKHGVLPPTLNYNSPDPEIGLEEAGFRVLTRPEPWPSPADHPRRMQVNAFGFGGASFVVHLEGAEANRNTVWNDASWQPVVESSASGESISVCEIKGRFGSARIALASVSPRMDLDALASGLRDKDTISRGMVAKLAAKNIFLSRKEEADSGTAWVFPGQGGWYVGMGRELYDTVPFIRETLDSLNELAEFDLLDIMFNGPAELLQNTRWQQPALFALEYAIAKYLMDFGITPDAVAGHSLGEFTALCVAGVLSPEDAFSVVCSRGRLMDEAADKVDDPGSMAATDIPVDMLPRKLKRYPAIVITNYNSPGQTVIGGPEAELDGLISEIKDQGFRAATLKVSMAFHSNVMTTCRDEFRSVLENVTFNVPTIPVVSNVTGEVHSQEPAEIVRTMVTHLESPVLWTQDVYALWEELGVRSFLEIGPSDTLCAFVGDVFPKADCRPACCEAAEKSHVTAALAWLRARDGAPVDTVIDLTMTKSISNPQQEAPQAQTGSLSILEQVIGIIMESTGYERDEIEPDMDIRQDLNIRSSRLPVIMDEAEQAFGLEFRIEDFIGVETIRDMANRIGELKGIAPGAVSAPSVPSSRADGPLSILEQVIGIIMESTGYEREEIEPDMDIRQDLNIRSSRLPVIMDEAEQAFGLEFRIEDFIGVETIRDMANRIGELKGDAPVAPASVQPAKKNHSASGVVEPELPVLRYEFVEVPVPITSGTPAFEKGGKPVAVVSDSGSAYGVQVQAWARSHVQTDVIALGPDDDPEVIGTCQGLIFALDSGDDRDVGETLGKYFSALKVLAENREKRFCMAVVPAPEPGGNLGEVGEGMLGMLLCGAMEYDSTVFRVAALEKGANLDEALGRAMDNDSKTVELIFRASGVMTREPASVPFEVGTIEPVIGAGDVVVLTGGGRGITAEFARVLCGLGVRLALLGRSPEQSPDVAATMQALRAAGCEATYRTCDVADLDAVKQAVDSIASAFGRVDVVVHGAGVIKDAFLQLMPIEDFELVLNVKLHGLKNVVESASAHGLRFAVAFSSVAAWHGNVGQAGYCTGNRAMAAYLAELDGGGVAGKTLWLPPVDGVGMANDPEVKKLLAMKGMGDAYVHVSELAQLVCMELAAGGTGWTLFSRPVKLPFGDKRFPAADAQARFGRVVKGLPMIDEITALDLRSPRIEVGRTISHTRDLWLPDHRPYPVLKYPLFSAVMAVESFLEAAKALYPGLTPAGARNVHFMDMIPCGEGVERRLRTTAKGAGASDVEVSLACRDMSPKGRQLDRWIDCYAGEVAMVPALTPLSMPIFAEQDSLDAVDIKGTRITEIYEKYTGQQNRYRVIREISGATDSAIAGLMVYGDEKDQPDMRTVYQYSPYVLEALMQLVLFHPLAVGGELSAFLPVGIGSMSFARRCNPGEAVILKAHQREADEDTVVWDSVAFDEQGEVILVVDGLSMKRLSN